MDSTISDIVRILHQMPDGERGFTYYEQFAQITTNRILEEQGLHDAQEAPKDDKTSFDAVIYKLDQLSRQKALIDDQIRHLITYARNFVRPRPYQLAVLAQASRISISGVRLISNDPARMYNIARSIQRPDISGTVVPPDEGIADTGTPGRDAWFRKNLGAEETPLDQTSNTEGPASAP
ncbi:hypothetical protein ACIBEJ_24835 [Nonomuraea sp. NPDC050790]|uniref:hypothetical protein n=1 Tax=Nonomuraea sp. NPDC050790 TaxID=3364371 RepID=UPI0037BCC220